MIAFTIDAPRLERLPSFARAFAAGLDSPALHDAVGRAAANHLKRHFIALNKSRNRHNSNFYADAAEATGHTATPEGAEVYVARLGIAQRYYGGTLRPTGGRKAIAIPLRDEARGKSPGINADELPPLFILRSRKGKAFLAHRAPGGALRLFYILVKSVTQRPDPTVLPEPEAFARVALRAADAHLDRLLIRAANAL